MKHPEGVLTHLWQKLRDNNSWVFKIHDLIGLDAEGLDFLYALDEGLRSKCKKYKRVKPDARDMGMDEAWIKERRMDYLQGEVKRLKKDMADVEGEAEAMRERDAPVFERLLLIMELPSLRAKKHKADGELWGLQNAREDLPEWKVQQARETPLDAIVERGRIPCPVHGGEGNNGLVKGDFFYCFSHGCHLDAIGWVMTTEGKNFKDAVNEIVGGS